MTKPPIGYGYTHVVKEPTYKPFLFFWVGPWEVRKPCSHTKSPLDKHNLSLAPRVTKNKLGNNHNQ